MKLDCETSLGARTIELTEKLASSFISLISLAAWQMSVVPGERRILQASDLITVVKKVQRYRFLLDACDIHQQGTNSPKYSLKPRPESRLQPAAPPAVTAWPLAAPPWSHPVQPLDVPCLPDSLRHVHPSQAYALIDTDGAVQRYAAPDAALDRALQHVHPAQTRAFVADGPVHRWAAPDAALDSLLNPMRPSQACALSADIPEQRCTPPEAVLGPFRLEPSQQAPPLAYGLTQMQRHTL